MEALMRVGDMTPGRFLKQQDVGETGLLLTMARVEEGDVGTEGKPETRWILYFEEEERGMVLNKTNIALLGKLYGDETDDWAGQQVVLYTDPNVMYGGKPVGGLRVRKPKPRPVKSTRATKPAPLVPALPEPDEEEVSVDHDEDAPF
jgi:hypothetical protein